MKVGMFEFRDNVDQDRWAEIVAWSENARGPFCWTICWFKSDKEGYNLESVGDRIVSYDGDQDDLNKLIEYAFTVLNARYNLEEKP